MINPEDVTIKELSYRKVMIIYIVDIITPCGYVIERRKVKTRHFNKDFRDRYPLDNTSNMIRRLSAKYGKKMKLIDVKYNALTIDGMSYSLPAQYIIPMEIKEVRKYKISRLKLDS